MATGIDLPELEEGQIWEYKTEQVDSDSTLRILKIEPNPKPELSNWGRVIHISLNNISIKSPNSDVPLITKIGHLPIYEKVLRQSLTRLVGKSSEEPDLEGYNIWKEDNGGVFTIF